MPKAVSAPNPFQREAAGVARRLGISQGAAESYLRQMWLEEAREYEAEMAHRAYWAGENAAFMADDS